jgi:adenylate kinase family enzyme
VENIVIQPGKRIAVIGSTGSGKTTLARQIAECLGLAHVEIDALHWGANWSEPPPGVLYERVSQAISGDGWVIDGNYSKTRDLIWRRADTIIWLDYTLTLVMWRLLRRTLNRVFRQEELWNGNRERFAAQFLSRESLFLWALKRYGQRKREYSAMLSKPEHAHLIALHFRSPGETREWLAEIGCGS